MGIQPNVVVGIVGAVVFLITGTFIASDFKDLTNTHDYDASVRTGTTVVELAHRGTVGSGQTAIVSFPVSIANVTDAHLRATWTESSPLGTQHVVTVTFRDAQNKVIDQRAAQGGTAGIALDPHLLDAPLGGRVTARDPAVSGAFTAKFPPHRESVGVWSVAVQANTPTQPGASDVEYRIDLQVDHYTVVLRLAPPTVR